MLKKTAYLLGVCGVLAGGVFYVAPKMLPLGSFSSTTLATKTHPLTQEKKGSQHMHNFIQADHEFQHTPEGQSEAARKLSFTINLGTDTHSNQVPATPLTAGEGLGAARIALSHLAESVSQSQTAASLINVCRAYLELATGPQSKKSADALQKASEMIISALAEVEKDRAKEKKD